MIFTRLLLSAPIVNSRQDPRYLWTKQPREAMRTCPRPNFNECLPRIRRRGKRDANGADAAPSGPPKWSNRDYSVPAWYSSFAAHAADKQRLRQLDLFISLLVTNFQNGTTGETDFLPLEGQTEWQRLILILRMRNYLQLTLINTERHWSEERNKLECFQCSIRLTRLLKWKTDSS